ncbi:MAG: HAMP domain-containing sensor histidine kinase [Chloroflexota bacterium]
MLSSLRSRLWLSYALLIVTALAVVAFVLVFYLIRNPFLYRQTLERVRAAETLLLNSPADFLGSDKRGQLTRTAELFDVRVVVFRADGRVLADTRPSAAGLSVPREAVLSRSVPTVRDADGGLWVYSLSDLPGGEKLLVAAPRPKSAGLAVLRDELLAPFIQGGAIALLLSLLAAFLISRWVADPLQEMLAAARRMPSDVAKPVEACGPREVQEVMRAFNAMMVRVQSSQRSQREFVANVSHELKTPLTSVQGFAQAILDGTAGSPDERQRAAEVIYNEAGRMHRMVLDLLDLARLEAGTADLKMGAVDMTVLLNGIAEKFAPLAQRAGIRLEVQASGLPRMTGDGDRLAQVFTNLVDNALKFTPPGGLVTLQARLAEGQMECLVSDSGKGISAEALPLIFDRFYQADASRARADRGGAGLGLAIVREIIQAHGGRISVRSQVGRGTVFTVRLPLAQPDASTLTARRQ